MHGSSSFTHFVCVSAVLHASVMVLFTAYITCLLFRHPQHFPEKEPLGLTSYPGDLG